MPPPTNDEVPWKDMIGITSREIACFQGSYINRSKQFTIILKQGIRANLHDRYL